MKFLALDQSLQTTGWAFFDDRTLVDFGHFTIPSNKPMPYRLHKLWEELNCLHTGKALDFEKIYFEDIQMQRGNALTYKKLAYVQAAIMMWAYFNDMPYEIYAASHWRKVVSKHCDNYKFGTKRADQKKNAKWLVQILFNEIATEDEADAILIGVAASRDQSNETIEFED